MEAECDVSIEAQTEVVVEDVNGELKQQKSSGGQRGFRFKDPVNQLSQRLICDLVRLMFVPVLRSGLGVRLHVQVPSVQLDNVSILDM